MSFAADLWPQLQQRTRWIAREHLFEDLLEPELERGQSEDQALQRAAMRLRDWVKRDAVISVKVHGEHFPEFQFGGDGEPLPAVARLNGLWPPRTLGLAKAAWLLAPNPNLRGAVPADLLASDPDRVVHALQIEHSIVH